jgi:hypothetical protein
MENSTINNECQELKNIKYKSMLLSGAPLQETKSSNDLSNLDKFLENEKNVNVSEPWCKLNKTIKTKKLLEYVEIYKKNINLDNEEEQILISFFKDCLDRKKLQRVKDVIYDKDTGIIRDIPGLCFIKNNRHFTLKNMDKRVSTLKSLAPKKSQGTIRKKELAKNDNEADSEEDEEN